MAKNKPSYDAVKYSGIAAGDDMAPDTLASYDQVKYSGISTTGQADMTSAQGLNIPAVTTDYSHLQNAGGDTAQHGC